MAKACASSFTVYARRTTTGVAKPKLVKSTAPAYKGYFPGGLYPEGLPNLQGGSPYNTDFSDALWPNWTSEKSEDDIIKIAETELIHGRWAMMGTAGAWGAEVGTGVPWFKAGALCTPDDCTALANFFPGEVIPLAPEGSGYPTFYNVLAAELVLMGIAESYRGGYFEGGEAFKGCEPGNLHPGGKRFDPLGLVQPDRKNFLPKFDLEEMKVAEIKHARLAMFSWLGYMSQAVATNCENPFGLNSEFPSFIDGAVGPYANWQAHLANPVSENVWKYMGWESTAGYI